MNELGLWPRSRRKGMGSRDISEGKWTELFLSGHSLGPISYAGSEVPGEEGWPFSLCLVQTSAFTELDLQGLLGTHRAAKVISAREPHSGGDEPVTTLKSVHKPQSRVRLSSEL